MPSPRKEDQLGKGKGCAEEVRGIAKEKNVVGYRNVQVARQAGARWQAIETTRAHRFFREIVTEQRSLCAGKKESTAVETEGTKEGVLSTKSDNEQAKPNENTGSEPVGVYETAGSEAAEVNEVAGEEIAAAAEATAAEGGTD